MAARVVELAEAVAAYVQSQTYSFTFNVKRENPAHNRLESTKTTTLYVYPGPEGPTTATRNKWQHFYNITIHLVNYVDGVGPSDPIGQKEIDDLFQLMEEIVDSLKEAQISGRHLMEFSTEDNPEDPYNEANLVNLNLAQSARRLVYMELRS